VTATLTATATVLLLAAACATPPPPGAATSGAPGPSSLLPTGAPRIVHGTSAPAAPTTAPAPELPGGRVLFPGRRLVALYGHPGTAALGVLGEQDLPGSIARATKLAASYAALSDVPVVPTFEIIATTASSEPGADRDYSSESTVESLRPWVDQAAAAGMYVVLDLQLGRADFLSQARRYIDLLRLPNAGLALDPEWHLEAGQKPLAQIGGVDAGDINAVTAWLAGLTATAHLPQKLLVLHQFQLSMIRHEHTLDTQHGEIQLLIHMARQRHPRSQGRNLGRGDRRRPARSAVGWKNFYRRAHHIRDRRTTEYQPLDGLPGGQTGGEGEASRNILTSSRARVIRQDEPTYRPGRWRQMMAREIPNWQRGGPITLASDSDRFRNRPQHDGQPRHYYRPPICAPMKLPQRVGPFPCSATRRTRSVPRWTRSWTAWRLIGAPRRPRMTRTCSVVHTGPETCAVPLEGAASAAPSPPPTPTYLVSTRQQCPRPR